MIYPTEILTILTQYFLVFLNKFQVNNYIVVINSISTFNEAVISCLDSEFLILWMD